MTRDEGTAPASGGYDLLIDPSLAPCPARIGLIWAEEIDPPARALGSPSFLDELLARAGDLGASFIPEERRKAVRAMLRHGKYRASGRGKPASEFLLRAAIEGSFPRVSGPVDVNNAVSLASGLPGSVFDSDLSGHRLLLRRGRSGEEYTFNASGQTIDLEDLLLVCRDVGGAWVPCGNPVKDAMDTKIRAETRGILAVLYAPLTVAVDELDGHLSQFEDLLVSHCGARRAGRRIVSPPTAGT
ncbi:MAG: hypothetical protein JSW65_07445 [Candidatus Bipolaricaulota bacterium]|nr:MAG: hypothetical protein JSW65_07445 [Candidatus Bipolaricaulota bacterium]